MVVNLTIGVHMADEDSAWTHTEFNQHLRLLSCLCAVEGVGDDRAARLSMRPGSGLVNVLFPQRRAVWADADLADDASPRYERFLTAEVVQHRIKKVIDAGTPDVLRHKIGAEEASTQHEVQAQRLDDVQRAHDVARHLERRYFDQSPQSVRHGVGKFSGDYIGFVKVCIVVTNETTGPV